MGEVWKARITGAAGFSRTLVIKRLLPHLLEDQRFVEMFLTEARLSARLEHPNIVQIFELGDINGEFFLAMEYVDGGDLGRVINQFALRNQLPPVPMAVFVIREVCRALAYAHGLTDKHGNKLGLIHRDVSPSNVMLSLSGAVKLLDFGVAKAAAESRNHATQTGVLKGKLWYMAPERVDAKGFDHRSDIFSTGVVMHEALTASRLFEAQNPAKVINLIVGKPIDPPSKANPEVPPELDRICLRALARNPDHRYPTAEQMANELDELLFKMRWSAEHMARLLQEKFPLNAALDPTVDAGGRESPQEGSTNLGRQRSASGRSPSSHPSAPTAVPTTPRSGNSDVNKRDTSPSNPRQLDSQRQETAPDQRAHPDRTMRTPLPISPLPLSPAAATEPNSVLPDDDASTNEHKLPPEVARARAAETVQIPKASPDGKPGLVLLPEMQAPPPRPEANSSATQVASPSMPIPLPEDERFFDENDQTRVAPGVASGFTQADTKMFRKRLAAWRWPIIAVMVAVAVAFGVVLAVVNHDSGASIKILSTPSGASVQILGPKVHLSGNTPFTVRVPRDQDYFIEIASPGYRTITQTFHVEGNFQTTVPLQRQ